MAKQIIVMERQDAPRPTFRVVFWLTVPAARQSYYADAAKTSAYPEATSTENGALQDGTVAERVETISTTPGASQSEFAKILTDRWTELQAQIDAEATYQRYGTYWDGTDWTIAGA